MDSINRSPSACCKGLELMSVQQWQFPLDMMTHSKSNVLIYLPNRLTSAEAELCLLCVSILIQGQKRKTVHRKQPVLGGFIHNYTAINLTVYIFSDRTQDQDGIS